MSVLDEELWSLDEVQEGIRQFFLEFLQTGKDKQYDLLVARKDVPGMRVVGLNNYCATMSVETFAQVYGFLRRSPPKFAMNATSYFSEPREDFESLSPVPYLKVLEKAGRSGIQPAQMTLSVSMFNSPDVNGPIPAWLPVSQVDVRVKIKEHRESFRQELRDLLKDVDEVGTAPALFWVYQNGSAYGSFLGTHRELPKRQVIWNLDSARMNLMKEVMGIGEMLQTAHSIGRQVGGYYEKHVWAETNRPGVCWHFVGWETECVGGEHYFLTVNVPISEFQPEKPTLW